MKRVFTLLLIVCSTSALSDQGKKFVHFALVLFTAGKHGRQCISQFNRVHENECNSISSCKDNKKIIAVRQKPKQIKFFARPRYLYGAKGVEEWLTRW